MADSTAKPAVVCVFCASSPGRNPAHMASARSLAQTLHEANISLVYGGGTVGIMGELAKTLVELSGRPDSVQGVIPRALIRTEKGYFENSLPEQQQQQQQQQSKGGKTTTTTAASAATGATDGFKEAEMTLSAQQMKELNATSNNNNNNNNQVQPTKTTTTTTTAIEATLFGGTFGVTTVVPDMHTRKRLMAQKVIDGGPGSGFVALAGGYGTIEEVMEMVTWNQLGIHHMPIVLVNIDGYWDGLLEWVRNSVHEGYVGQGNAGILVEVKETGQVIEALRAYQLAEGRYQLDWSSK